MLCHIKINNIEFQEDSSLTILQVAKKHGIKIPTLCYLKKEESHFEHKPASCRVCLVEIVGKKTLVPACATYITNGMEIFTNTKKVRRERRIIVELLLSNHPHDCLTCDKCGRCDLQDLAIELGIKQIGFKGPLSQDNECIVSGAIKRNPSKCVLCNRCTAICEKVQSVCAISPSQRGYKTIISEPFNCVNCGQCVQVCPTGALMQVDDTVSVERELYNNKYCVINTAPAVRVSLGEEFGLNPGTDVTGKMITALRMLGFKKVFDTNFAADLTIMEETTELVSRLKEGKNLPLITSCCPGWINFIETQYPELLHLPSSCKSPQEMFASVCKTYFKEKEGIKEEDLVVVSLMPCIAKKEEAKREELKVNGKQATDYVLSVKEFAGMLRRFGIDLSTLEDGVFDSPLGESTGAATIFGNTGGVTEAVVRTASLWLNGEFPKPLEFHGVFGVPNTKETYVELGESTLHICVVSGLSSARIVLDNVKSGKVHYDVIEIMACPSGCINGGGQPVHKDMETGTVIALRKEGLRAIDRNKSVRASCENESIKKLYEEFLKEPNSKEAHHLLHTTYSEK
ncbi:MAG: 4Fe-4S dicluster domain-containing protein [Erysipelotrichaceae bacterium]|nr:4Fe-4S dicluster domain-containing protein [Erysipelotrichaceae bacterium]